MRILFIAMLIFSQNAISLTEDEKYQARMAKAEAEGRAEIEWEANHPGQREREIAKEEAAIKRMRRATKPECMNIRFTGVAAPAPLAITTTMLIPSTGTRPIHANIIEYVLASPDIEDTLARNPIRCTNHYRSCKGLAYFEDHKGRIVDWNKDLYGIDTAVDFNSGRKDIQLTIRRKDAVCAK
jgi:hypothetical protein